MAVAALSLIGCKNGSKCGTNNYVRIDTLYYQNSIDSLCSAYVDDIYYVSLKQSENHIIQEATKVETQNNKLFILSKNLHKIVAYSLNGDFLFEINKLGKGSQEYSEIANFTVDDKYIYIVDNLKHQIIMYSCDNGKYKNRKDISFVAWDIACLSENEFLFAFLPNNPNGRVNMKQPTAAVWKTDSTFSTILEEFIPYHEKYTEMIGKNVYFTKYKNDVVFHSFQNEGYMIFSAGQQKPQYTHIVLPQCISSISEAKYEDVVNGDYMYLSETPFILEDYIVFAIGKGNIDEPVLLKKKDKKFEKNKEYDPNGGLLFPSCVIDDKLVVYLSDKELYNNLVSDGFPKANEQIEQTLENGGACLIVYSMKLQ